MQVIRARAMGMCFGVLDAIAVTETVGRPDEVTIHGELVHNEQVNAGLAAAGFASHPEVGRGIPQTRRVMITAHGVSDREREKLKAAGKDIIDTTCPLVRRAHETATHLAREGWHVVIAGKRGHVEVVGLSGDLDECTIVECPEQARYLQRPRIAVVCQTTLQPDVAVAITEAVHGANPDSETRLFNTICRPTRDRQSAMQELLPQCDAVVVVGGAHSNNTRQLVRLAESAGKPVCHVQSAEQVDVEWASQFKSVGLTAGTSTPDVVIDGVYRKLAAIAPQSRNAKAGCGQEATG